MTGRGTAWRGLAGLVFGLCAGALWLGGEGSLRVARTVEAWSTGRSAAPVYTCPFRRQTGMPCPGWALAAVAAGIAAWALSLAAALTLLGAGGGWLRVVLGVVAVLSPAAFVINGVVWWMSLPLGPR